MSRIVGLFIRRIYVDGSSMAPTYNSGERLTALRRWRRIRPGDVVVVRDPREPTRWLMKRCVARAGNQLELRGDNREASTDSRDFGTVASRDVKWLILGAKR